MVDDVANAVVLLINTIYFSGYWAKPFDDKETAPQNFFVSPTVPVTVPFMKKTDDFYYTYAEDLDAQILRIPYKVRRKCLLHKYFLPANFIVWKNFVVVIFICL